MTLNTILQGNYENECRMHEDDESDYPRHRKIGQEQTRLLGIDLLSGAYDESRNFSHEMAGIAYACALAFCDDAATFAAFSKNDFWRRRFECPTDERGAPDLSSLIHLVVRYICQAKRPRELVHADGIGRCIIALAVEGVEPGQMADALKQRRSFHTMLAGFEEERRVAAGLPADGDDDDDDEPPLNMPLSAAQSSSVNRERRHGRKNESGAAQHQ